MRTSILLAFLGVVVALAFPLDSHHQNQRDRLLHRRHLRLRHREASQAGSAAGFATPSELYERDADVLPPPDKNFTLIVNEGMISPDGFERMGFHINGEYPAETLVWDENDDVEIRVFNNGTVPFAIHWHGIHQIGSPEMDGVPGVNQWNIYSGESFTYRFKLTNQYGGYWYHSHERGYYADGLRGSIYIRPKPDRLKPWNRIRANPDEIDQMEQAERDYSLLFMSDHWHINHTEMLLVVHETGVPPACFDSLLLNGRGRQYCMNDWKQVWSGAQAGLSKNFSSTNPDGITSKGCISLVPAKPGYAVKETLDTRYGGECQNTTAPLSVLNAATIIQQGRKWMNIQIEDGATNWYYGISIDGHSMYIVAVDGHYIEPIPVQTAQVTIGSRLSVMVELDEKNMGKLFPIRLTGMRALQPIEGHAFLSYVEDITDTYNPSIEEDFSYVLDRNATGAWLPMHGILRRNETFHQVWQQNRSFPFQPETKVPQESNLTLHAVASQGSLNVWQIASVPLDTVALADERPMLFNVTESSAVNNSMKPYVQIPMGTVVDIIMENNLFSIVGGPNSPHPFHLHSRRFWIIGTGTGPFRWDSVAEAQRDGVKFNLKNPPLRDGFDINNDAWVAIRYVVDHAAANVLHCHIDDHAIEGMMAVLLEGLESIPRGGNFSESIKARPSGWIDTQHDELGQVLHDSYHTGAANGKWFDAEPTNTINPWGDPRPLASSIQDYAISLSVSRSRESARASATATASR